MWEFLTDRLHEKRACDVEQRLRAELLTKTNCTYTIQSSVVKDAACNFGKFARSGVGADLWLCSEWRYEMRFSHPRATRSSPERSSKTNSLWLSPVVSVVVRRSTSDILTYADLRRHGGAKRFGDINSCSHAVAVFAATPSSMYR